MKGLQYMALEVATVMTAVGVNKDIIEEGANGLLAVTDEDWLQKISLLIESAELRNRLGKAGRKTIEERFSFQGMRDNYTLLFENLISK